LENLPLAAIRFCCGISDPAAAARAESRPETNNSQHSVLVGQGRCRLRRQRDPLSSQRARQSAAGQQIQNVLERVRGSLKCSIRNQRPITFPGATAREIIFEKCPPPLVDAKQRILIVSDWLYQLLVLGKGGSTGKSRHAAIPAVIQPGGSVTQVRPAHAGCAIPPRCGALT
jgi:hypothetical protein